MFKKTIILGIAILVFIGAYFAYDSVQYRTLLTLSASDDATLAIRIIVPTGSVSAQVASDLEQKNVIRDAPAFVRYLRSQGWETKIQAGEYILKPSATIPDIAKRLTGQVTDMVRVTIPEGYTVRQINNLLLKAGLAQGEEFFTCLRTCPFNTTLLSHIPSRSFEGFLFPETYLIDPQGFVIERFIEEMLSQTKEVLDKYQSQITAAKRSLYDILIMASMVEKEAITDEERPIVAGILWKRLDNGWFLAVDATTRYEKDDWQHPITATDLAADTPYNTRKRKGLPPTPISNPGEESIRAALLPSDSPYWYYLHDRQRTIRYARTQEEHDVNRAKYLNNL